jgi:hypothetical protein
MGWKFPITFCPTRQDRFKSEDANLENNVSAFKIHERSLKSAQKPTNAAGSEDEE